MKNASACNKGIYEKSLLEDVDIYEYKVYHSKSHINGMNMFMYFYHL